VGLELEGHVRGISVRVGDELSKQLGMMIEQLSLAARPRTLSQLVGQDKLVAHLRGHFRGKTRIKAWFFSGKKGTGKTTVSRILALSYLCAHQKEFGEPCINCRRNKSQFSIHEINCASVTGIDKLRESLEGADYGVLGAGRYKIYVLDEVHRLSDNAQDLLLKYLEDTPRTTIFILCSTKPHRVTETIRSRCQCYELRELESDQAEILVTRLLTRSNSQLPADRLMEALSEKAVRSPRLIAQAVDRYIAGEDPDAAAEVSGDTAVDTRALTRAVVKGDWPEVARRLQDSQTLDIKAVRMSILAYLRVVLLESPEISRRTKTIAVSIKTLCLLQNTEDLVVQAGLTAVLYELCSMFSTYKL
jgi:DNA polymerase III subunit gamma/tau